MKYTIKPNFFSLVVIFVVSAALYNQFDFETYTFKKLVLSCIYGIGIVLAILFMIKKKTK